MKFTQPEPWCFRIGCMIDHAKCLILSGGLQDEISMPENTSCKGAMEPHACHGPDLGLDAPTAAFLGGVARKP
jgi:hypothetical protein